MDTQGLLQKVVISPADVQDTDGVEVLLERIRGCFPGLKHIWVGGSYKGEFITEIKQQFGITVEVVKHKWSDLKRGVWLPAETPPLKNQRGSLSSPKISYKRAC